MSQAVQERRSRDLTPADEFKHSVESRQANFAALLPAHMPVARFEQTLLTAVMNNRGLLMADRASLMEASLQAARDGLLPDGREGALVIYRTKAKRDGRDEFIQKVQWMPMVQGIIKKIHNSGEITSLTAGVVYEGDHFRYWVDDQGEHLEYEPGDERDMSVLRRVFAMAVTKDGKVMAETLWPRDLERIKMASRSGDSGPWKTWPDQMAIKSAIRRLSKRLPVSTEMMAFFRTDDDLYEMAEGEPVRRRRGVGEMLGVAAVPRDAGFAASVHSGPSLPPPDDTEEKPADPAPAAEGDGIQDAEFSMDDGPPDWVSEPPPDSEPLPAAGNQESEASGDVISQLRDGLNKAKSSADIAAVRKWLAPELKKNPDLNKDAQTLIQRRLGDLQKEGAL